MRAELRYPAGALWCVVLAAGGSSRLGRAKQLVRYKSRPLILRAMQLAAVCAPAGIVVVLGADALRLRALLRRRCSRVLFVKNSRWNEGLSTSLRAGIRALPREARAALILVTDQPRLQPRSLRPLLSAWRRRPGRPVAARYGGEIGVPAIVPRKLWRGLRSLKGDTGARALLRGRERLTAVEVPEAAFDVDTPADLDALRGSVGRRE